MKLVSLRIQNYKCIDDSTEFSLSPVTCLVGKNESGKSAVLEALYHLKPVEEEKAGFIVLDDYPRKGLTDYEKAHGECPANVLTATFEIEAKDEAELTEKYGVFPLKEKTTIVTKGYDNKLKWTVQLDEDRILEHCLLQLSSEADEIIEGNKPHTIKELLTRLENLKTPKEEQSKVLSFIKKNIPAGNTADSISALLSDLLPRFLYFSEYHKVKGRVSFNDLERKQREHKLDFQDKIFLALLDLAGTKLDEIQKLDTLDHLIARLEGVSSKLTREIFTYWSQNQYLRIRFLFETGRPADIPPFNCGYVFMTQIENKRHEVSVNFENRSAGFVWFFSFLVWLSQVEKNFGENLIILLDEPGLSLHAKAQADLLTYINEKLMPKFQVIYTAHSPFMVDSENILNARTVEDVFVGNQVLGTKVGDKVLSTDSDTLFPLQAALGYEITQTLFVGKHTLLVEGPSDLLYLKWFSKEAKAAGRVELSPRWTITPVGGIGKIGSFITLFGGNKLHVAAFTDFHEGDKKKIRELRESELLKQGHVLSAESYVPQTEADTEDLLGRELYIYLVNKCYGLTGSKKLPEERPAGAPTRVIAEVEEHFRTLPASIQEFNHYYPASFLFENSTSIKEKFPDLSESVSRFEALFNDLNGLLEESGK